MEKIEAQQPANPLQVGIEFEGPSERLDRLLESSLFVTDESKIEVQLRRLRVLLDDRLEATGGFLDWRRAGL